MARARVEAAKITPQIGIALVEVAKVAPKVGLSPKCGHRILLIPRFGVFRGGISINSAVDRTIAKFWRVHGWKH